MRCPACSSEVDELAVHLVERADASDPPHVMWLNRNVTKTRLDPAALATVLEERHPVPPTRIEQLAVDRWFADPPRFVAAMASEPSKALARAFVLEWTKFSRLFPRWVGAVIANCPEFDVLAFEVENLMSEVVRDPAAGTNHYELLVRLGEGAGLTRAQIEAHEPCPEAKSAFGWWWEMAHQPDWVLGFTAINGLEILGDRALPRRYGVAQGTGLDPDPWARTGIPAEALEFFRVSDEADAGHGSHTVEIISTYARDDGVLEVLDQTMSYLRGFMGGMWRVKEEQDGM